MMEQKSILWVCLGNICRSPAAEGICRSVAKNLHVDSAATSSFHVGQTPDRRSQKACKKHGVDISCHRAKQVKKDDFRKYNVIVALDNSILSSLNSMKPKDSTAKVVLFNPPKGIEDPYYGDDKGFDTMYNNISSLMPKFLEECGLN